MRRFTTSIRPPHQLRRWSDLFLVQLLLLALPTIMQAQFTYVTNNGAITITGYTGSGGNVTIPGTINSLPVTSIGEDAFYFQQSLTNITIPDSVLILEARAFFVCASLTNVVIPTNVLSIGDQAFSHCTSLSSITIPSSVTNVGAGAFASCERLTAIAVGAPNPFYQSVNGVLFNSDQSLLVQYPAGKSGANYAIPSGVARIGASAFARCSEMNSVTIPSGVTNIGDGAFYYCFNLQSVTIPNSVTRVGDEVFYGCWSLTSVTIPGSVTRIGARAFYDCGSLSSVSIPTGVTSIEAGVFGFCGLSNVTIPGSVTNIGEGAFQSCGLSDVVIPGNVARIEANAFAGCWGLTSLTLPNGVASIEARAFFECYSLTNFSLPQSVTNIGASAFGACSSLAAIAVDALNPFYRSVDGVLFNPTGTLLIQFPSGRNGHYTIPNSVTTIGANAFEYATGLSSITIGNGVTDIQDGAFYNCYNLTSVAIGNSVANIGPWAFGGCSSLTSIALPNSVAIIGDQAFAYCYGLIGVVFNGDAPILGGANVFDNGGNLTVYYLPGTSGWGATLGGRPTAPWLLQQPLIILEPASVTVERSEPVTFAVRAVGRSALSYQWKHHDVNISNGGNITGANTADLTIWNVQLSDSGAYTVVVSDAAGSIVSQPAQLTVSCLMTNEDQAFSIRSFARDTNGPLTLMWDSFVSYLYEVQTSESLTSTNWMPRALIIGVECLTAWPDFDPPASDNRFYRVQRYSPGVDEDSDGLPNIIEFNRGTDLHNPDTDGDQMPDGWEAKYDLNPLDPNDSYSDLDGDGYSNREEYQAHTRPNDPFGFPANPPRPAAWWKLDEGTGTNALDSSLNGHHGYLLGGNPAGVWTAGYLSNAVTLGGPLNTWIEVPYQASLTPNQELTVMGWVKPSGPGVLVANVDPVSQVSGNYLFQFGPDNVELRFSAAGDGSFSTIQFNPNWSTNDWHHVAVCYRDGTNVSLFVDGEWRAGQIVTGPFVPAPNSLLIGFPGLTNVFSVDDVRLYNRALDTNEIAALSRGNGLPIKMIVGQTATLRAFGASDGDACQWSVVSGQGFFTNTANTTTEFRPSWSGTATLQVVYESSGVLHTNVSSTTVSFPALSPLSDWNDGGQVQLNNNCYNFATDIRTDTRAQPGGPPFYYLYTCPLQTDAALSDGLQAGVDLADLCHTSGLPEGHIVALLIWSNWDFHYVRMEANGTWSSKAGNFAATTLDNSGQPIVDPRTANFSPYQFCGFFWVGPEVNILHFPQ